MLFEYFLFVHITLLIPGYVLLQKLKSFDKRPGIQLSMAYAVSIVFFGLLATLTYALKIDPLVTRALCWLVLAVSFFFFIRQKYYLKLTKLFFPLACFVSLSLFTLVFIGLSFNANKTFVPDPEPLPERNYSAFNVKVLNVAQTQANDNYVPYRQAQFFVNRSDPAKDSFIDEWGVHFFVRTPLMGAVTANYFNLLDDKPPINYLWSTSTHDPEQTYLRFQVIAHILNALFIIPAYFLIGALFSKRVAMVSLLFIITSQFFLYNSFFSWPKSLVAFFILTSWLLLREPKLSYALLAGFVSGVAYLTHDLAVLYIGASFIFLLLNKRFRELAVFTIPSLLLALPWLIISSLIYNKPSSFIYYPISTEGVPHYSQGRELVQKFLNTPVLELLKIRLGNIFYLFSPFQLLTSEGGQDAFKRLWGLGLYSIPGAVGIGLIVPMYAALIQRFRSIIIWVFIVSPVILFVLLVGWPKAMGALHFAEALVVLTMAFAISFLLKLRRRLLVMTAYLLNVGQLGFFIAYSYDFTVGKWFTKVADVIALGFIVGVVAVSGWLIWRISTQKDVSLE